MRSAITLDLLQTPGAGLRYLVAHDAFAVVRPLSAYAFASFCKDRGLDVDERRLETFERLGAFYPIARVEYPRIKVKIERVGENQIREFGMLQPGEEWKGELREENSRFSFRRDWAQDWLDTGALWDPRERPFERWSSFRRDGELRPRIESFYSPFQAFPLAGFLTSATMKLHVEAVPEWSEETAAKMLADIKRWAEMILRHAREGHRNDDAAFLAQAIANRYYFSTRSDRRTIRVSDDPFEPFDWGEFARTWDPHAAADGLGLTPEGLADVQLDVSLLSRGDDPLADWYEFVSLDKRERLKGDARLAQLGYTIDHMLRLFYQDLTGKRLRLPHERHAGTHDDDPNDEARLLEELQYLVNEYHLNPKPRLIFVVEGDGEELELPRLSRELLGYDFAQIGVEMRNLHGVGEFTGALKANPFGALEKFIDDHHARQTIVYCLFDREGDAVRTRERLVAADSRFVQGRKLTSPDYIHLWNDSIEFDNFSDEEIAAAMTAVSEGRYTFTGAEVSAARAGKTRSKVGNPLHDLYESKLSFGLNKKSLLRELFTSMIADRENELTDLRGGRSCRYSCA